VAGTGIPYALHFWKTVLLDVARCSTSHLTEELLLKRDSACNDENERSRDEAIGHYERAFGIKVLNCE